MEKAQPTAKPQHSLRSRYKQICEPKVCARLFFNECVPDFLPLDNSYSRWAVKRSTLPSSMASGVQATSTLDNHQRHAHARHGDNRSFILTSGCSGKAIAAREAHTSPHELTARVPPKRS